MKMDTNTSERPLRSTYNNNNNNNKNNYEQKPKALVCKFYFSTLKCKNGNNCKFIHSTDRDLEKSLRQQSNQQNGDRNRSRSIKNGGRNISTNKTVRSSSRKSSNHSNGSNSKKKQENQFRSLFAKMPLKRGTRPLCDEFKETGKCKEGDRCKYSHNPEDGKQICTFFMKYNCINGENCKFVHDYELRQDQRYQSKKICRLFLRGECTLEDKCKNYHVPVSEDLIDPSEFEIKIEDEKTFEFDEDEVKKLNLMLDIPFKYKSLKAREDEELILIRHSLSYFNYNQHRFFYQTGKSFKDPLSRVYQTSGKLIDSALHPYGIIQCQNSSKYLEKINIHTVFISPLRRSLETAFHLFKGHPRRLYMKFIVLPQLSEILGKAQDISDIRECMKKYSFFDFSLMNSTYKQNLQIWQIIDISPEELKLQFLDDLEYFIHPDTRESIPINTSQVLLNQIDRVYPKPIESVEDIYKRSQQVKEFIQRYIMDNLVNVIDQKIAVISHNCFIKNFTCPGIDEKQSNTKKGLSLEIGEIISQKL